MFDTKSTVLTAPPLANSSCWQTHKHGHIKFGSIPAPGDFARALFVLALSVGIVAGNLMIICVLNSRRYSRFIDSQPRYLLTSLALNDLFIGILVAPVAMVPALYRCWPYGEIFCQIQALLRGALSQQSAVILVCMAIDRYLCLLHPERYHRHSSKKGCVLIISITWILSVSLFAILVLPGTGYYFNSSGLMACDVFHSRIAFRILSCCAYYFPTTMTLMYCYGSGFHVNKVKLKHSDTCDSMDPRPNGTVSCVGGHTDHEIHHHHAYPANAYMRQHSSSASRTMAAMSLGFIVMVTPATIQEVVAACTGCKVPALLDFVVTWLALSDSFWNPFLYWLLNNHFRRISSDIFHKTFCCQRQHKMHTFNKSKSCCGSLSPSDQIPHASSKTDVDGLSEKYWGEILERTVSSTSLHALQKAYHGRRDPPRWNGSLKNYGSNKSVCDYHPRFFDTFTTADFHRGSSFYGDIHDQREYQMKPMEFRLFENHSEPKYEHNRSNLSLDEIGFSRYNGRLPDL